MDITGQGPRVLSSNSQPTVTGHNRLSPTPQTHSGYQYKVPQMQIPPPQVPPSHTR